MMLVMGLLLFCAFGGLAIDRLITAAVMGENMRPARSAQNPTNMGDGLRSIFKHNATVLHRDTKTPNAVAIIATALPKFGAEYSGLAR
jgi:hypothetical protein